MADNRIRFEEALRRGHAYSWDQRWPEAIVEFNKAIAAVADEPAPYAGLGMAYYELGELDKALTSYKMAARAAHGDLIYLKHVAAVQERLNLASEAGQTYMAIGEIHLRRKKLDEAVGNWLRAVTLEPSLIGAHQRLAAVYRRQGLTNNAVREYLAMAQIYNQRGEREMALKVCRLALELDPKNAPVLTAIDLIRQGEEITLDEVPHVPGQLDGAPEGLISSLEEIAADLDLGEEQVIQPITTRESGLLLSARAEAQQRLAQTIFSDGDGEAELDLSGGQMTQLERDALLSQALDFQTRGLVEEAIDSFQKAIAQGLYDPAAHFCLGLLYRHQKRPTQAITEFEQATSDLNLRAASYYAIGDSYRLRGDSDRALEYYTEALKHIDLETVTSREANRINEQYRYLTSDLLTAANQDGKRRFIQSLATFLSNPEWDDNVREARRRLENISTEGQTLILGDIFAAGSMQVLESLHLSQEYASQNKFDSAVEEAYQAIQLSPFYLAGHIQLASLMVKQDRTQIAVDKYLTIGDTYRVRGDISGAIVHYEKAIKLAPLDLSNRKKLIDVLIRQGQIDRALEHYMIMAEAYYNLAEMDKARETYQEALKLTPQGSNRQAWRLRLLRVIADIDMQRLDWKRAQAAYSELYTFYSNDEEVVLTLIDLHYKVGQPKQALTRLDEYLGRLVKNGQGSKVIGILENLTDRRPGEAAVVERLVRLYIHQGRNQDAVRVLDALGEAQLESGQTQAGIRTIERILRLNPPNAANYRQLLQRLQQEGA